MRILIRGGQVLDGTGAEPRKADVLVAGQRIEQVVANLRVPADRTLDASGLVVAPGFIDIHAHGDLVPLACPEAPARLHDGVTTEIIGNCGESPFPQSPEMLAERKTSHREFGLEVDWATLDDYARRHDGIRCAINRGSHVGHGNVRRAVMGEADRPPTPNELEAMRREVAAALQAGAFGFSTGLIYAPGMYARREELEAICEVVARHDGLYASHIRGEGDRVEEAVEEFAAIGRATGVRLQHSHVKVAGRRNWPKADRLIQRLLELRAEGLDLACDRYPYRASATSLSALFPGWLREGGREEMLRRLADPATRQRLARELAASRDEWADWSDVVVSHAPCPGFCDAEGRSLKEIAAERSADPALVACELLAASRGRAGVVMFSMSEENIEKWLRLPFVAIASDSSCRAVEGPTARGKPHPRTFGTFARVLRRYVRERRVLSLAEAVRRMTSLPASRLGLADRGVLRPGAFADITVFDPDKITDRATYQNPFRYSEGVCHVLVNGAIAMEDGEPTGVRNGRFLRKGR